TYFTHEGCAGAHEAFRVGDMEGRRTVTFRNGGGNGGSGVRGPMSAERARLQAFATEFQALLAEAVKSISVQGTPIPEPKHFWLVPILHRLASIAEFFEASYCREPGVNAFDNRRYMHPIGVAIRLATLGSVENDRYSQPTRFISEVLFGLLRSGGGVGGGAMVLAAVCRFLCAVSMATADQGSRTAPPPPISTLLSDDLELYGVVLSWARGERPPSIGGGNGFDGAAARTAMKKGLEVVRTLKAAAHPGVHEEGSANNGEEEQTDVNSASTAPGAGVGAGAGGSSGMSEEGEPAVVAGAGSGDGSGGGEVGSDEVGGAPASASAAGAPAIGRSSPPPPPPAASTTSAAKAPAVEELAGAELRAHATGLVAAGLLSRQASDLIVNKGFAAHLVQRLREGAVAQHLGDEAASEQDRLSPLGETGVPGEDNGGSVGGGSSGAGAGSAGRAAGVVARGAVSESSAAAFSGPDDGAAAWSAVMSARACPSTPDKWIPKYGRWTGVAAVEAEHVAACISAIGGYQEILAPLFSGDGLAVVDLLLANPQLEVRVHAVELLSALLVHKKVGLAFVRRGWVRTVLRLGALENGSFLEPEIGFCLHGLAASGGVMEAVCRVQDDTLERLLTYAASLLRSPSESTQRNAMLFWEAAMRFPPALEAFDRHGGVSKLLYLLLPTAQGYSDAASSGTSAAGRAGSSGTGVRPSGAGTRSNGDSSPPRQRSRWWQMGSSAVPNGGGGGTGAGSEALRGGREQGSFYTSASAVQHRRSQVTLGACSCVRQYLRCSLALAVLKQQQRAGGDGGGGGSASRQEQQQGRGGTAAPSTIPRTPGRPAWQCKPLSVDDASHAAHVVAVKGKLGRGTRDDVASAGVHFYFGESRDFVFHGACGALVNVVDTMLSQRTMGAETAIHALDALATAALCPLVYPELCRPGTNNPTGGSGSGGGGGTGASGSTPSGSQPPPADGAGTSSASAGSGSASAGGGGGSSSPWGRSRKGSRGDVRRSEGAVVVTKRARVSLSSPDLECPLSSSRFDVLMCTTERDTIRILGIAPCHCASLMLLFVLPEGCLQATTTCAVHYLRIGDEPGDDGRVPNRRHASACAISVPPTTAKTERRNARDTRSSSVGRHPPGGQGYCNTPGVAGFGSATLIRERNGIRVLVGLLRYRRQVAAADAVRLRAALCLLGLAHDVQIAQVLEKMRITTTLSDTVRAGPVVGRNVESYSQLREAAKQIIARVAGRLSGTVGRSGLMDPAVTGLERAAVVANTPITFRPRELLGFFTLTRGTPGMTSGSLFFFLGFPLPPPRAASERSAARRRKSWVPPSSCYLTPAFVPVILFSLKLSISPFPTPIRTRHVFPRVPLPDLIFPARQIIHEYLAANGLAGSAAAVGHGSARGAGGVARGGTSSLSAASSSACRARLEKAGVADREDAGQSAGKATGADAGDGGDTGCRIGSARAVGDGQPAAPREKAEVGTPAQQVSGESRPSPRAPAIATVPLGRAGRISAAFAAPGASGKTTKEEGRGSGGRGTGGPGSASGVRARSKLERSSSTPSRLTGPSPSSAGSSSAPSTSAASRGKRSARAASASSSEVAAGAAAGSGASDVAEARPAASLKPLVTTAGGGWGGGIDDDEEDEDRWAASPIGTPRGFYPSVPPAAQPVTLRRSTSWGGYATAAEQLQVAARSGSHHHTHAQGGGMPGSATATGTTALDKIVTSFLRNQHERCPDPICVLPPLSLAEPHSCPDRTPAGALGSGAPPNVAKRVLAWQVCARWRVAC
ncbi:unnamed protein product, partial [Scytosiphon promiscuus]